ncbi:MAG: ankyrin repeat domain-containing protein [Acidobacteria bacterium]|nr:ankyrin repeat domain-containing protein [Acidobacteriota bacterium]
MNPPDPLQHFDSPSGFAWANAIQADDLPRLRQLADSGDPQAASASGMSPLRWALECNRPSAFAELLHLGAQPDPLTIHAALLHPSPRFAQLLLAAHWNPNSLDPNQHPWLFTPLLSRNSAAFRLLVENGADVNASRPDGLTPLIALVSLNEFELAFYLLERGADPAPSTSTGASASSRALAASAVPPHQLVWRQRTIDTLRFRGFASKS